MTASTPSCPPSAVRTTGTPPPPAQTTSQPPSTRRRIAGSCTMLTGSGEGTTRRQASPSGFTVHPSSAASRRASASS